ncbi:hypothetical protein SERLA73DRAFT_165136 [Serpula lacrymans var. lacrymans S7.3]|uniref:AAA+ ATPase domain-containing protein n=1 Tax=Serpula lacrymans var. lacrymans (strain S7.3) TaxID=936435 RepID=F8PJ82_SERL3|nr:hypothetical protein SERLA73DRAFT_165136 [Serpula lacrymans var. lacrymans S7.3]
MNRETKLKRHFDAVIYGRLKIEPRNSLLFLEAIYNHPEPVACINNIVAAKDGLSSVQSAMHFDISIAFLNGPASLLFAYLLTPQLKSIAGGTLINEVVLKIVDPPLFFYALLDAFRAGKLEEKGQQSFAALLLHLICLPDSRSTSYRELAQNPAVLGKLVAHPNRDTRALGERIKHILSVYSTGTTLEVGGPGGRHDNDFSDFRQIAIVPTADEITCTDPPFLRSCAELESPEAASTRTADYLDNQFRLLREDMLCEMREELQIARGKKKGHYRGLVINGLDVIGISCGTQAKRTKWAMTLKCRDDLPQLKKTKDKDRKTFLTKDNAGKRILRHQSLACILVDGEVTAFATVTRDEELLAKKPPIVVLQIEGDASTMRALLRLKTGKDVKLVQIDTAIFAFEPVLKAIQGKLELPLSSELLFWEKGIEIDTPPCMPTAIIHAVGNNPQQDLRGLLTISKSIVLDRSQAASLMSGLTQRVSLIQGPPGTGKSFIGALLAKILHDFTEQTILVVCYTNHALDQFLEDLLDIGIPESSMVRLGGKSTTKTENLSLYNQKKTTVRRDKAEWSIIDKLKTDSERLCSELETSFKRYMSSTIQDDDILRHLEFEDPAYFDAFSVPETNDGMTRVGKKGKEVGPNYLINQWRNGWDAGIFKQSSHVQEALEIWNMSQPLRQQKLEEWKLVILQDLLSEICRIAKEYDNCVKVLGQRFNEGVQMTLKRKRIIGCTTTAAAKYREDISAASPDVLLVEEAGEILESHIITALGPKTKQLILIGDHKQLRPKVNNYLLTVEKGEGYDLNRSLFERLVLKQFPHQTLTQQHRMRPEISSLIRALTYPDLVDAAGTKNRPALRGVQSNIVFVSHDYPEDDNPQLADRRDMNASSSKQNSYEIEMVLKIVRYLAQQGYGTEKLVILTPYLAQLHKLQAALREDNDPILNDLDSYDLVRAGLMTQAAAKVAKKPLRLATVDNYQGEESNIVIVSLTRSNPENNIGFMFAPERLNVLLSRARDALILIGNSHTFMNSRTGGKLWKDFFDLLKRGGHLYNGFPVQCDRHPTRIATLSQAFEFDEKCPDGGCNEPCGAKLNCNLHLCPSKCHQLYDHSKMPCEFIMYGKCTGPKSHDLSWQCYQNQPLVCSKCERDAKLAEIKRKRDFALQEKREAEQAAHARKLAEIDQKIDDVTQTLRDEQLAIDRDNAIRQKYMDFEAAAARIGQASAPPVLQPPSAVNVNLFRPTKAKKSSLPSAVPSSSSHVFPPETSASDPERPEESESSIEWERQKEMEGVRNDAIDSIMEMTGLEDVKRQVLRIKAKIDVVKRQGTSLNKERFNLVLLGNPGTGKTTVARLYAKFLTSIGVLPGSEFIETTGSRLANDGVAGAQKHVDDVINAGGGAIFIDEAYLLTSEHNFQGRQVLDFLLAEMENRVGSIVFILAGYNKQMEKFFEHNPGLPSRVPYQLQFADYTDLELLSMLEDLIKKKYGGKMKVEGGIRGLYARIVVRRLGRGRNRDGFGNARALQNIFSKICERQAERINNERKDGLAPDDFLLVKEDLIGPNPSSVMTRSKAWDTLRSLIGLQSVKDSVQNLFDLIHVNYLRELREKEPIQMSLNRVFLGSPGTGKTTVAKLYGQILADMKLLSNGEVVVKNPADFVGAALGQSESNTKAILANTVGKVLVIDEAYMLYDRGSGTSQQSDPYKTAVIDTIVAEVQSVPGEDRCVLLLGYKDQIVEMFQNVNPGLSRRFAIENAFHFENFTDSELREVLRLKVKQQQLGATEKAEDVAIEMLSRARNRPNFGNAGEVENILGQAKGRYQTRQATLPVSKRSFDVVLEPQDFDPDFDRNENASTNLVKLFEDIVGSEDIIKKLGEYQQIARTMKAKGIDPRQHIPTNFVFKGPPGTGKTTTARKMGQVYYDMGFLSNADVVECSASDLVGQYVGQTGPKTKKVFEKALGKVLFVDEAYRLGEGHFAKEAMDELVGLLTHETFKNKLIVILAGYDQEMNNLMAVNTGLSSRFTEEINFPNMSIVHCIGLLVKELTKMGVFLDGIDNPQSETYQEIEGIFGALSGLPSWGNARDVKNMAEKMIRQAFMKGGLLTAEDAVAILTSTLDEKRERLTNVPIKSGFSHFGTPQQAAPVPPPSMTPPARMAQVTKQARPLSKQNLPKLANAPPKLQSSGSSGVQRDPGVSDAIWRQLEIDKLKAKAVAENLAREKEKLERDIQEAKERVETERKFAEALASARAKDDAERSELKRQREQARLREATERVERARLAAALEAKRQEERKEQQAQAALRRMGVCVAGFQWIKGSGGYRCAGGSHFISDEALESAMG